MKQFAGSKRKQFGQGMMEYVIIVALIAVAAIGVYSQFGKTVRNQTAGLAKEISGQNAGTEIGNAGSTATLASTRGNVNKGMGQYNVDNDQGGAAAGGGGGGGGGGTPGGGQ